jgi:pyruvate dehydrogenase E2 component (dihydrolipoamide acetyltransferase)
MATDVLVPPLGTNVDTVTLVTWYKRAGEPVVAGEPLFAVETDKAVLDVEAPASGILQDVSASEGDEVPALSCIARIGAAAEGTEPRLPSASSAIASLSNVIASARNAIASPSNVIASEAKQSPAAEETSKEIATPRERHPGLAMTREGQAASELAMTREEQAGGGLAVTEDEQAEGPETIVLKGIRGKIADRMYRGTHETASVTLTAEVDATRFVETRKRLMADGMRVTYNDMLLQIVAQALTAHPRLNATYEGDRAVVHRRVDIALAVDTDRGLMAPVVRGVDAMDLWQIAASTAAIIERARNGRITPEELHGSTFTITNLGMFGIDAFTPIINVPECAILGVGRIKPVPWVVGDCVGIRQAMWLSLTFDHRFVDGGPAARFLQAVALAIESCQA